MTDWRTMETAPKDGSKFVMLCAETETAAVGYWLSDVERYNVGKKLGEAMVVPSWFPLANPSHWAPLPA